MHKIKPYLLNLLFTIPVIIFTLYSCASKPNIPYPGRMSENFAKLEQWNPLLASEIRKLPEFQDGIAIQEEKALDDLVELYLNNPKVFSNAFKQMYQVGKPEVRKYCSPLQALFWLAEDGRNKEINEILQSYSIERLLDKAWVFPKSTEKGPYIKVLQLTKEQVQSIIVKMSNEKQVFYEGMSPKTINDVLLIQYKDNPSYFPREIRKTIKSSLKEKPNKNYKNYVRWNDFNTVADRINTPELFNIWINMRIKRGKSRIGYTKNAEKTFKDGGGDCSDIAELGARILRRSGYNVKKVCQPEHVMGYIKKNGLIYVIIDFGNNENNMHRKPYKDIYSIGNVVDCGPGVNP